jgi:hypothetical protein
MDETTIRHLFWNIYGVRHEYSKDYILLTIKNYNKLKDFEKAIEDTLAERVKTYADNERTKETVKEKEFEFNYSKCQFFYKGEVYRPRNETKREFIKKLWEKHHKQNNKKQIITQGERLPESYFAIKINMIREVREFENKRTKRRFKETKKELNRIFRDKKFPIKIDSNKEGLLLIRTIQ